MTRALLRAFVQYATVLSSTSEIDSPFGEANVHQSSMELTEANRETDVWLMGVFSEGMSGFVGPFELAPLTPAMLGLGVPYSNLGTSCAATEAAAAQAKARTADVEKRIVGNGKEGRWIAKRAESTRGNTGGGGRNGR